jgi:hypothetical protein
MRGAVIIIPLLRGVLLPHGGVSLAFQFRVKIDILALLLQGLANSCHRNLDGGSREKKTIEDCRRTTENVGSKKEKEREDDGGISMTNDHRRLLHDKGHLFSAYLF